MLHMQSRTTYSVGSLLSREKNLPTCKHHVAVCLVLAGLAELLNCGRIVSEDNPDHARKTLQQLADEFIQTGRWQVCVL